MRTERWGDAVVGAAGTIAGTIADPRRGFGRLRAAGTPRGLVMVAAGMAVGFLLARACRRG